MNTLDIFDKYKQYKLAGYSEEMAELHARSLIEASEVQRNDLVTKLEFAEFRGQIREEFSEFRGEMRKDFAMLRREFFGLRWLVSGFGAAIVVGLGFLINLAVH